jgi:hypothetical protein
MAFSVVMMCSQFRFADCNSSQQALHSLAITDLQAAHRELTGRGVTGSGIRHKPPIEDWKGGWQPGGLRPVRLRECWVRRSWQRDPGTVRAGRTRFVRGQH